jgi:hypothetical protein
VEKMACGYRNKEHPKIAIYFRRGNLKLYRNQHESPKSQKIKGGNGIEVK